MPCALTQDGIYRSIFMYVSLAHIVRPNDDDVVNRSDDLRRRRLVAPSQQILHLFRRKMLETFIEAMSTCSYNPCQTWSYIYLIPPVPYRIQPTYFPSLRVLKPRPAGWVVGTLGYRREMVRTFGSWYETGSSGQCRSYRPMPVDSLPNAT